MKCSERRQGNTTQQKDKAKQHNTTQLAQDSYFQRKKLPRVGFEPTSVRLLGVRSYQLSYRGTSVVCMFLSYLWVEFLLMDY